MLVTYKESTYECPLGIAVAQWKIEGDLRTYILYPIQGGKGRHVEVEVAVGSDDLGIVAKAQEGWQSLGEAFGDDSVGYPCDEATEHDLYDVWDDGAIEHLDAAARLYKVYGQRIAAYVAYAKQYLAQKQEEAASEAKSKGWDASLTEQMNALPFPYNPA